MEIGRLLSRIALLTATAVVGPCLSAQASSELTRKINDIKQSSEYVYAESTTKDLAEASENAKVLLAVNVEDWLRELMPSDSVAGILDRLPSITQEMQARRGALHRAFLYVRKSDLVETWTDGHLVKNVDPVPTPGVSDEVVEVILAPPPAPPTPEPLSSLEQQMLSVLSFDGIKPFVTRLEKQGVITDYGKYATLPTGAPCYVFIYDRSGKVVSHIKMDGDAQTNLSTRSSDSVSNYKHCGAIWFRISNQ